MERRVELPLYANSFFSFPAIFHVGHMPGFGSLSCSSATVNESAETPCDSYEEGIKISNEERWKFNIRTDKFHGLML
ncbi:MAG: hypothetical protein ACYDAP_01895 [Thermoplasmataceae archaeon]